MAVWMAYASSGSDDRNKRCPLLDLRRAVELPMFETMASFTMVKHLRGAARGPQ